MIRSLLAGLALFSAAPAAAADWPLARRDLAATECPVSIAAGIATRVSCWKVAMPLAPGTVVGGVQMSVAVIARARAPSAPRRPIVYLHGGAGAGLRLLWRRPELLATLATGRPVILFDHRGTGASAPKFTCAAAGSFEAAMSAGDDALKRSGGELRSAKIDVNRFGPMDAASDRDRGFEGLDPRCIDHLPRQKWDTPR